MIPTATIVVDLGFGDAGKGSIVDFLTRRSEEPVTVVRFNGGPQAAHNVVTSEGLHHTFSQFGSGTLVPGTQTFLSRFMLLNPFKLLLEAEGLGFRGVVNPLDLLTIDRESLVISPFQVSMNRLREIARGDARHGSCGQGVGEATSDHLTHGKSVLFAADLTDPVKIRRKLRFLRELKAEELREIRGNIPNTDLTKEELRTFDDPQLIDTTVEVFRFFTERVHLVESSYLRTIGRNRHLIFEAAQGVLLDEWFGFFPYTTWSTTTFENALQLLTEAQYEGKVTRLGLTRAYATRHGAGPFVTEDQAMTESIPDDHNGNNQWQREFRVGHFDLVTTRFALEVCKGVDALVVTCLDRLAELPRGWAVCGSYHYGGRSEPYLDRLVELDGEVITAIKVPKDNYIENMGALTKILEDSTPQYLAHWPNTSEVREEKYLESLERELDTPIGITSHGVTSADKRLRCCLK